MLARLRLGIPLRVRLGAHHISGVTWCQLFLVRLTALTFSMGGFGLFLSPSETSNLENGTTKLTCSNGIGRPIGRASSYTLAFDAKEVRVRESIPGIAPWNTRWLSRSFHSLSIVLMLLVAFMSWLVGPLYFMDVNGMFVIYKLLFTILYQVDRIMLNFNMPAYPSAPTFHSLQSICYSGISPWRDYVFSF